MNALFRALPILIAAALAFGTWLLADQQRRAYTPPGTVSPTNPDFILDHPKMARLGPDGRAQTLVSASRLLHYMQDDRTVLDHPHVLQTRASQPPVTMTSDAGESVRQAEEVRLSGDVRMTRAGSADAPPLNVRTEKLIVRPDEDRAFTDVPVVIDQGASTLRGNAMEFDNSFRTLVVTGDVRATVLPARKEKR